MRLPSAGLEVGEDGLVGGIFCDANQQLVTCPRCRSQDLQLSAGERGCAASHLCLWRRCSLSKRPMLILEVGPSFISAVWSMCHGARHMGLDRMMQGPREASQELCDSWT